jgi:hypothetical protein
MMKRPVLNTVALAAGLVCAVVLLWLARKQLVAPNLNPVQPPLAVAETPWQERAVIPPAAAASEQAHALLLALQRMLPRDDLRANEAVLTFKDDAAFRRFLARAHAAGLSVLGRLDVLRTVRIRYGEVDDLRRELADHAGDYAAVSGNHLIAVPHLPATQDRAAVDHVPFGNRTLAFLGAEENTGWGRGVTIAILDTGVASDATFDHRLRVLDIGLGTAPGEAARVSGHGTAIAALAAGSSADAMGIAPAAGILSIRVTDETGVSDLFTVAQAMVAAIDAGAQVINISLGGYSTGAVLDAALGYASQRGVVVVAAAGNDQAAQLAWPAADPRVVSVGAIDAAEQQVTFSNSGRQLQLTAPGYGVQTAWLAGDRVYLDGTSASAPLVAGAIAAVLSQQPGLTAQQAAQTLVATASDAGAPGADPAFGHGILNLGWAMNRNNPAYVDPAIASHLYDSARGEVQVVVQNRSGRSVTGLSLKASAGGAAMLLPVPPLAAGEIFVGKISADRVTAGTGSMAVVTELTTPPGMVDRNPANNRKTSVLTVSPKR